MKSLALFLILVMFWAVGLLAFTARIERSTPAAEPQAADAIVALTGNATVRITTAVKLLEQGKGERLLVSGVNKAATPGDILGVSRATRPIFACCVQLGFEAADTKGNARETAAWVKHEGYKSLIVVTADYHMPRAMLELKGAMPGVTLTPYPVKTEEIDATAWWKTSVQARRMLVEYSKYLAVFAREAFLSLGPKDPAPTPQKKTATP
jgi:uncharacterized SAM-binding protein YcdF (DUF218 family)